MLIELRRENCVLLAKGTRLQLHESDVLSKCYRTSLLDQHVHKSF